MLPKLIVVLAVLPLTLSQTLNSATITAKGTTYTLPPNPLPSCAVACEQQAFTGSTCTPTNLTCVCLDPTYAKIFDTCEVTTCNLVDQEITNAYALGVCGVAVPGFSFRSNSSVIAGPSATPAPTMGNGSVGGTVPFVGQAVKGAGSIGIVATVVVGGLMGVFLCPL